MTVPLLRPMAKYLSELNWKVVINEVYTSGSKPGRIFDC